MRGRKLLITGATGFIGSRLASLALRRGAQVWTLTRSDWSGEPAVPVAQRIYGEFPACLPPSLPAGLDALVHCAASLEPRERAAKAVNVAGTMKLAQAARSAGCRAFIFLSSQSAKPTATSAYGRTKHAAEEALRAADGVRAILLRPGLVCGPGSRGLFQRMCHMVNSLPVVPLLGGGRAWVQPIHVDDLCEAIFACVLRSDEFLGRTFRLGDPQGLPLRDFLQLISQVNRGRRKPTLPVPLWPVELAVKAAEALGLPLPINSNNLKGLRLVEKMETAPDLASLGLALRPLGETVRQADEASANARQPDLQDRAVRMFLVGGGRIGLVHALTLSRARGIDLRGVVDAKTAALKLLKGMGIRCPVYRSLEAALRSEPVDAAVIATPAATHLPLARAALQHGLGIMVEKPLAVHPHELTEFRKLAAEHPSRAFGVGYVMVRNPQVSSMVARLRRGELGRVRRFLGITLHAHILRPSPGKWEVNPRVSGGGALINSGGHVLSMIHAAFGAPRSVTAESLRLHSELVEDSLVARLEYPNFGGAHCSSWSIPGYQRQENRLVVWTDKGTLLLGTSSAVFLRPDAPPEIVHQLDFDVGFNLAPDYAGAGFTTEVADLATAVRQGRPPPMSVQEAISLEECLFDVYRVARKTPRFQGGAPLGEAIPPLPPAPPSNGRRRILDLRELAEEPAGRFLDGGARLAPWNGYLMTTSHLGPHLAMAGEKIFLTVPDFLRQTRLLMAGRHGELLKRLGAGGVLAAGLSAAPTILKERGVGFWAVAEGLLAGDLRRVPREFTGTLLLHGYLTDLALSVGKIDLLQRMIARCRAACPGARVGFHTNLAGEAVNALARMDAAVDDLFALASPSARGLDEAFAACRESAGKNLRITAEIGPAPALLHQYAVDNPSPWAHGADAFLLGPAADPTLGRALREEKLLAWGAAFPGLEMPECVL
jgi:predicted dehydrogenase/nucleoside-diphosphate-sugar epimerase